MSAGRVSLEAILPFAAPAPAGVIVGAEMYHAVMGKFGIEYAGNGWLIFFSVAVSLCGCVAMIGCEMQCYKWAGVALADGNKWAALLSFVLALCCTGLIVWATWGAPNAVIAAVSVAVAVYGIRGIREYIERQKKNKAEAQQRSDAENARLDALRLVEEQAALAKITAENAAEQARMNHALAMERERTSQERANARAAKSITEEKQVVQVANPKNKLPRKRIDLALLAEELQRNPNSTNDELGKLFGVTGEAVRLARAKTK